MRNILLKEMTLSASPLAYLFLAFGLMFLLPGYPILCGAFFVTLGLFQSFQAAREANDIVYSALLPIAKADVVKGRFLFVGLIEVCALAVMILSVGIRMTGFGLNTVYRANALMNANLFALGCACVLFGLFNWIFVRGFFKTAYKFARPFITYLAVCFLAIGAAEAAHHIPGLEALNAFGTEQLGLQIAALLLGAGCWLAMTWLSCAAACRDFEKIDL